MGRNLKLIITLLPVFLMAGKVHAQVNAAKKDNGTESLMPDVNYAYLEQLIDTAKKYYPESRIKAQQTKIATTTLHQSQASWFEGISISPSYVYNPSAVNTTNANGSVTTFSPGYQIAFNVNLSSFITRPYITRNARQAVTVAQLQQDEYKYTIEAQVKRLYVAYILAKGNLRVAVRAEQDAQINAERVKHNFQEATTTLSEYNSILAAAHAQSTAKLTAEAGVLTAKFNLEEFVGKRLEEIQ